LGFGKKQQMKTNRQKTTTKQQTNKQIKISILKMANRSLFVHYYNYSG
jgi:hypothetical protein